MLACYDTAATSGDAYPFEWSLDREEALRQFDEHLRAIGFRRGAAKKAAKRKKRPAKPLPPATCWEEAFARTMPGRPLVADDFPLGVYPCRRQLALGFRYIQYNGPTLFRYYVADIDRANAANAWKAADVATPNYIMENPENGHAHLAWLLAVPVSAANPFSKPFRFLAGIERGYMRRLDADKAFCLHGLVKNALHPDWRVSRLFDGA